MHERYTAYNRLKTRYQKAGIKGASVHALRHTFASNLVLNEVGLYTAKELLGHANIRTTETYTHLSDRHLRDGVQKLENCDTPGWNFLNAQDKAFSFGRRTRCP